MPQPEKPLTPEKRQELIEHYLGSDWERAYSVGDHQYVFLTHLSNLVGPVMVISLDTQADRLSAGIYSPGPKREISQDPIQVGYARNERIDSVLQRLSRAKLLSEDEATGAFELLIKASRAHAKESAANLLSEETALSRLKQAIFTASPLVIPTQQETSSAYALLVDTKIIAVPDGTQEWSNNVIAASAICRFPDSLTNTSSISISASPIKDPTKDFQMAHFSIALIDSRGTLLEPHFNILPEAMVFLNVKAGETYTIIKLLDLPILWPSDSVH